MDTMFNAAVRQFQRELFLNVLLQVILEEMRKELLRQNYWTLRVYEYNQQNPLPA